ncbi:response regulator transcription factor [Hyphomicrobium sp.]|uniref:response regulator transcription factor n=1 Tax=Hyphomicrobium sp. TaxID=82 RepID=UPI002D79B193|nr:response regulator transcription factor [Hyphomicrobium sp.]HET6389577.1 response regulator transcription factor [Hyphomicrobium sp.]
MGKIRVLLVDDHAVVRQGYRRLIEAQDEIEVVGEAEDASSAYQAYKKLTPDVSVIDISMPGRGGIDLVRQIRLYDPVARILMFTMHANASYAEQAFKAGAQGYVTKSSPPDVLVSAIKTVFSGRPALCAEINKAIAADRLFHDASALEALSPREFEILRMILDEKTNEEIADAFSLSPKTVANYHYSIRSKLGVRTDIELVYYCIKQGLATPLVS